jgi:membrane protease YdiL (CAAX protease family)
MFIPGLTAIVLLLATGEGLRSIAWKLPRPAYLAYGILLPASCALVCFVAITRLGIGTSPHIPRLAGTVLISGGTFVLGRGEQSLPFFLLNFAVTAVVLSCVSGLVTVGEEIGWRGFLQPRLVRRLGNAGGIALLGFIWAHWHTPLVLHGFNYPATPRLGAWLLWPATCILVSFMLGWLSINGASIWPAVVAHG